MIVQMNYCQNNLGKASKIDKIYSKTYFIFPFASEPFMEIFH